MSIVCFCGFVMERRINDFLEEWRKKPERRSLLVRGARQVGKTYSIRQLGREFDHFVEVNFEETSAVGSVFEESLDPKRIVEWLSAYFATPIIPGKTLLFLDEIQACPKALSALRFFHEKMPELHVVAAGSLLEFALEKIPSQGVGRIESLFMFPFTFREFVEAQGEAGLFSFVDRADSTHPVDSLFHQKLVDKMRMYQLIGGLPAVVQLYIETGDVTRCMNVLDDLITTFEDDFNKYRERVPVERLSEVFRSVARQTGGKFKYAAVDRDAQSRDIKQSLGLLVKAGLAHRVVHTAARGIPLGAETNPKRFKMLLFDVGIYQRLLGLDIPAHVLASEVELVNKGGLAEMVAGLEILGHANPRRSPALFYWHREVRGSSAEVDYLIQQGNRIVPVEVKAGHSGKMISMHRFLDERDLCRGIRVSLENFSAYGKIETCPLYALDRLGKDS